MRIGGEGPDSSPRFGRWSYDLVEDRWAFSPELVALWDIGMGESGPLELVLERLHPADRPEIERRLLMATTTGVPLSGQGRLRTDHGQRVLAFFGTVERDARQQPVRLAGWSIDVTEESELATREAVDGVTRHRSSIEQLKGALMAAYHLDEAAAFAVVRTFSNQFNVKTRELAERTCAAMSVPPAPGAEAPSLLDLLERHGRALRRAPETTGGDVEPVA